MPSKSKVYFFFNKKYPSFRKRGRLKKQIELLFRREGKGLAQLNYIFCSDGELLKINRQYLGHDYYTDIVTFDLSETKTETLGEIYISIDRVKDNAAKLGESVNVELARVIFHGALHLCGYKDKTQKQQEQMREKEEEYLSVFKKG
ncbi:MAG TPA: rRNA maturation RNase YbeY [Chitinophagaceae bacterium]|nr:rRNA maturation RNase YbeY [Chitinophagaceae bacterium]